MTLGSNSLDTGTKCPVCPLRGSRAPASRGHQGLLAGGNATQSHDRSCQRQDVSQRTPDSLPPQHTGPAPRPLVPHTVGLPEGFKLMPAQHGGAHRFHGVRGSVTPRAAWMEGPQGGLASPDSEVSPHVNQELPPPRSVPVLTRQKVHQRAHASPALRPHRPRMRSESEEARSTPCLPLCPGAGRMHVLKAK